MLAYYFVEKKSYFHHGFNGSAFLAWGLKQEDRRKKDMMDLEYSGAGYDLRVAGYVFEGETLKT